MDMEREARIQEHIKRIAAVDPMIMDLDPEPEVKYLPRLTTRHINTLTKRRRKEKFRKPPPKHPDCR